jgi:hypothetical protein
VTEDYTMITHNTGIGAITATLRTMRAKLDEAATITRAAEALAADGQPGAGVDDGAGCGAVVAGGE